MERKYDNVFVKRKGVDIGIMPCQLLALYIDNVCHKVLPLGLAVVKKTLNVPMTIWGVNLFRVH